MLHKIHLETLPETCAATLMFPYIPLYRYHIYTQCAATRNIINILGILHMCTICSMILMSTIIGLTVHTLQDTAGQERFHALGPIYYRDR